MEKHSIKVASGYQDWQKRQAEMMPSAFFSLQNKALSECFEALPLLSRTEDPVFFLNYYHHADCPDVLKQHGLFQGLNRLGFQALAVEIELNQPQLHRLAVYHHESLVLEIQLKRIQLQFENTFFYRPLRRSAFDFLGIEWLGLQDPRQEFSLDQLALPGQAYPGLGLGEAVLSYLNLLAHRLGLDGVLMTPVWFHNATLSSRFYTYLDPLLQGKYLALQRDCFPYFNLAQISWALEVGCTEENRQPFSWFYGLQILPFHAALKTYLDSSAYQKRVHKAERQFNYLISNRCLKSKKPELFL